MTPEEYIQKIGSGDRAALARAITLVESNRPDHRAQAEELVELTAGSNDETIRIGITGAPGVGKSTTIERLGLNLIEEGNRVAVLAIDPSSTQTGGSILGDKTRMQQLANHPKAFVRPSPAAGTLGGVAAKTREAMLLCEAAGFNIILIETVGTGQSEISVTDMVDMFVVLLSPGSGDELQGIKKGVIEHADIICINKSDGDNIAAAQRSKTDYQGALQLLQPKNTHWTPPVLAISGETGDGPEALIEQIMLYKQRMKESQAWQKQRQSQQVKWMWALFEQRLKALVVEKGRSKESLWALENEVASGTIQPNEAASQLLASLGLK